MAPVETVGGADAGGELLPGRSEWLVRGFQAYARRYVARHLNAVRLLRGAEPPMVDPERPLVVVMNHPSWWDPLAVAVAAPRFFPSRAHYAPIDQAMLVRYPLFGRLGFFGVEPGTAQGARVFLRTGGAIVSVPRTGLWMTAEGGFRDVRLRPVRLRRGVGHLATRMGAGTIVPLALELIHWQERTPEMLLAFGQGLEVDGRARHGRADADAWVDAIGEALEATMERLARASQERDEGAFGTLLAGRAGVGGVYDVARRLRAWAAARRFDPRHRVAARKGAEGAAGGVDARREGAR